MLEQTQSDLFASLSRQAGPGFLPTAYTARAQLVALIRNIEQLVVGQGLEPIIVYWSSRDCSWLLPDEKTLGKIIAAATRVSAFSQSKLAEAEEFSFILFSQGISLVLYGRIYGETSMGTVYQCVGSVAPHVVRRTFTTLASLWRLVNADELSVLLEARDAAGEPATAPQFVTSLRNSWPISATPPKLLLAKTKEHGVSANNMQPGQAATSLHAGEQRLRELFRRAYDLQSGEASVTGSREHVLGSRAERAMDVLAAYDAAGRAKKLPPANTLREVWTHITKEVRSVYLPDAQKIIQDIILLLRQSGNLGEILQLAIEELVRAVHAERGIIWQLIDGNLVVTAEFASNGHGCFKGLTLGVEESNSIVDEFLSRFPDEFGSGVVQIDDLAKTPDLHKQSPTLAATLELGDVRARLLAQLRCRGTPSGYLELQQCQPREWTEHESQLVQSVSEVLSFVVQQAVDLAKINDDARGRKLINEIAALFRNSSGHNLQDNLARSAKLIADHLDFEYSQVYLYDEAYEKLYPQLKESGPILNKNIAQEKDPFWHVLETGKHKVINPEPETSLKADPYFGKETALIVPLLSEGEKVGVLGLWKRRKEGSRVRSQEKELALTIGNSLASIIRADLAVAKINATRKRQELINEVSKQISQSLKEIGPLMETLVRNLTDYLQLSLCVASLYEPAGKVFYQSRSAGEWSEQDPMSMHQFAEELFSALCHQLSDGQTLILDRKDIASLLADSSLSVIPDLKTVILAPMIQSDQLKGALCMVSVHRDQACPPEDMHMLDELCRWVAINISHKDLFERVERQAVTDAMTGLYNRRYFQEQFSREMERHQRFGHPFSYIIIDLDYLKKINDNFGHHCGDAAIKHIAQVLKKCVRDIDTTARYGGEEFVAILPETDVQGARIVAERMCAAIREAPVEEIGTVTASIGVATFPDDTQERDLLMEMADQALYLAKHRGRNRVCSVSEDLIPSLREKGAEAQVLEKQVQKSKPQEEPSYDLSSVAEHGIIGILGSVMKLIEEKDSYDCDRSPRAAEYASNLAQQLHLSREHVTVISLAAILCNLGKAGVDPDVLQKPGPLSPAEMEQIRRSPIVGKRFLEPARYLHRVAAVIEAARERWDGNGYPRQLRGEEIPLEARVISIIDAFVAMTSDRPYRKALSKEEAMHELYQGSGSQWDPRLVKAFISLLQKEV